MVSQACGRITDIKEMIWKRVTNSRVRINRIIGPILPIRTIGKIGQNIKKHLLVGKGKSKRVKANWTGIWENLEAQGRVFGRFSSGAVCSFCSGWLRD